MSIESELRSISSGRPLGTFGEAATRAMAWHWLGKIIRIAGVEDVTELDRNNPRHPLSENLSVSRRFESIQQDGYDPDRVEVTSTRSLLKHVAEYAPGKSKYRKANDSHGHAFWKLLTARNSPGTRDKEEIHKLLRQQGLVRLDHSDVSHGMDLGLISEYEAGAAYELEECGELPFSINAISDGEVTLEALQLLLLLYREAQDLAQDQMVIALRKNLLDTALRFAETHGYAGEQLDTWHYLIQTRMLRWDPDFQPRQAILKQARQDLLDEWDAKPKRKGKRGPASPETYTKGRAERRWRRQIWARACRLSFEKESDEPEPSHPPEFFYTNVLIGDWLIKHRDLIAVHCDYAVDFLMNGDVSDPFGNGEAHDRPPPLTMPESMHRRRKRPRMDEETWRHFGDRLPYDVIPITILEQ